MTAQPHPTLPLPAPAGGSQLERVEAWLAANRPNGTCDAPGPEDAACTLPPGHRAALHYDLRRRRSWRGTR